VLERLEKDIRFAVRWLRRSPGFTLAAAASLAIGIGFNSALFSIVDALLFRPLPVSAPERLVDVFTSSNDGERYATSSYPDFLDLKAQNVVFADMLGYSPMIAALNLTDRSRMVMGECVTGNYFQVLGVRAALGRTLLPEDDVRGAERVVMVSHRYWRREMGADLHAIGQAIRLRGQVYTVVGVAPHSFTGMVPILSAELWLPVAHVNEVDPAGISEAVPSPTGTNRLDRRGQRWMFVKGRLKPGFTLEQARDNLEMLMRQLSATYPQTNKGRAISVLRTSEVRIHPEASAVMVPVAAGLMLAVGLVLLIACANVASMVLARGAARRREIGIRLAVGASRSRLVQQLLTESVILALLGALGGVALAVALVEYVTVFDAPLPLPVSLALRIDTRVLLFTLGVTLLAGLAAGLVPALRTSNPNIVRELRGEAGMEAGTRWWTLRDALVAGQVAGTMMLLVTAGLLARSVVASQKANLGFQAAGLAIVSADPDMQRYGEVRSRQFWDQALARVRALPGVESAALAGRLPFSLNFSIQNFYVPGFHRTDEKGSPIQYTRVTAEYFHTLGIPVLQGRCFTEADTPITPAVAIINETMARRFWPGESAVGKRIHMRGPDGPACEIVGVAADYRLRTVGEIPQPYVHLASTQRPDTFQVLVARTRGIASRLLGDVRRELLALEPNLVLLDNQTMDAQVAATLFPVRAGAWIVSTVGLIAMMLAAVGLYGVISYSVARRTREIGIRMALGASRRAVLGLVMRQGLSVTGLGLVTGCMLSAAAVRAVTGALYGVSTADPVAWGAAAAVLIGISALANLVPALRAARVDPSAAIRVG
jgi:predicted permease